MNVIISNKFENVLSSLDIEVIKSMTGEFTVEEIIDTFSNFYFQRMILDLTAISGYRDITKLQKLSISLDMSKVILVLDGSPDTLDPKYLSKLISMGIYNFTTNKDGILYLLNHPNQYRDVAHLHNVNPEEDGGIDITQPVSKPASNKKIGFPLPRKRIPVAPQEGVSRDTMEPRTVYVKDKIIGFKNITDHAGSSSLIYMIKKQLENKVRVIGIEVDGNDFPYFKDVNMVSCTSAQFGEVLMSYNEMDVILVDIKNDKLEDAVQDMIYLIEPSVIKINKLVKRNAGVFEDLKGKKVILNRSTITSRDVLDFEYETRLRIFHNVPCLNDREKNHKAIVELISKLGIM